ncbi:uncharacterized protein [Nicotiana tomentosiformis]|uniref:uncharacterized protein n=1 Tax=Nicotiana tomentosiformis TaxID=4098 RepID=UPI00388C82CF
MGRKLRFIDTMTQVGLFPADSATSQVGGGAQTPTAQAPGNASAVYRTPGTLSVGGAQLVAVVAPEPRSVADGDPHKLLDRWTRLHPLIFRGERHEDPEDFIDRCRDRLHNMRILESNGVDFTTFQLEGRARRWWQSYLLGRLAGSPPMTWDQFSQLFLDRYIPPSQKEELQGQFEQLKQGQMPVTDYDARFSELSRDALMILPTNVERVRRFVVGLHFGIRASMAREVEMRTNYQLVVEIARRIEGYRLRGREQMQQDKSTHFYGVFRGAPARGRVQQGHQPIIVAPAIQPPRGGGQTGRGRPRGGGQEEGGQPVIVQPGGGQPAGAPTRFYDFPAIPDAVASYAVITGIISICDRDALILFDPGSTYSYVSSLFAHFLDIPRDSSGTLVYVSTPVGDSVVVDRIYRSYVVTFRGYETRADLLLLDVTAFEVILGMDWLSLYHAILDCHANIVTLAIP